MPTTVFHTLRLLEPAIRPVYVYRENGITIVVIDPRHKVLDVCLSLANQLSDTESNIGRDAHGWPPRGVPLSPAHVDLLDRLWPLYVPASLRLPGEAALQGGDELVRREAQNDLDYELDMLLIDEMQQTG